MDKPSIQKPTIGKDLLQTFMLQLYSDPRCIYREYIQNSLDAINDAVKLGILSKKKDGQVLINIGKDSIKVEDNGTGIKAEKAAKTLMDVANSIKNGVDTAGQFGIGRLSGGGYCEALEFCTSYKGEATSTVVSMDINKLRTIIDDDSNKESAEDAMSDICTVSYNEEDEEKHYFRVTLKNIINSADVLLNEDEILSYIRQTAPIDYSTTFNTLINSSDQKNFVERHRSIDTINVSLNNITNIEKGYGLKVAGSGDEIVKLRYFELPEHPIYGKLAWGWYAVTPFTVQIKEEKDENVGIRLRKHNISLDRNYLDSLFRESRGNKYFYGEVFITNDNIRPNSARQGLAPGKEADALMEQLRKYFDNVLHSVYYKASRLKNLLSKVEATADRIEISKEEVRRTLTSQLENNVDDFQKALNRTGHDEVNDIIDIYAQKYKDHLEKKVSNLILTYKTGSIPSAPRTLAPDQPRPVKNGGEGKQTQQEVSTTTDTGDLPPQTETGTGEDVPKPHEESNVSGTSATNPVRPTSPRKAPTEGKDTQTGKSKTININSLLNQLVNSGKYSDKEIKLLKEVMERMDIFCPKADKKKLNQLMMWAIKSVTF